MTNKISKKESKLKQLRIWIMGKWNSLMYLLMFKNYD